MGKIQKTINVICNFVATIGIIGALVAGGWQDKFFPEFFIMAGVILYSSFYMLFGHLM